MEGGEFAKFGNNSYIGTMADRVTNEQILECVKAIGLKVDQMASKVEGILADLREFNREMASFLPEGMRQDKDLVALQLSLDRIEKRLELND